MAFDRENLTIMVNSLKNGIVPTKYLYYNELSDTVTATGFFDDVRIQVGDLIDVVAADYLSVASYSISAVASNAGTAVLIDNAVDEITFGNGTAADPSIAFTSDPDTGFYRVGANQLGVTTGGVLNTTFVAAGIIIPSGLTLNNPGDFIINIDSDNSGTTAKFVVSKNTTGIAGTELFKIEENATATFAGGGVFAGAISVDDTTDSTSATTGSIHTDGGLGVAKALWVGGTVINMANIPTSDPSVAGHLWANVGVVTVSAG